MTWEKVMLKDVCEVCGGTTPKTSNPNYWNGTNIWLSPVDLPEVGSITQVETSERKITELGIKDSGLRVLPVGSLVFSTRASIGKIGIVKTPLTTNQGFTNLIPSDKVNVRYLAYALKKSIPDIEQLGNTTTFKEVSRTAIKNFQIPLPPLHIQEQIADTLDKADALRRKDQELLQKYDQLAQAIFYDMFGDPVRNERGWQKKTVRDISREVKYGTSSPAEENGMYPYLRMNNITYGGELDLSSLKYINVSEKDLEKYGTQYSDLLFNRTNSKELVGKTTVVDINTPMVLAGYLIRVRLNDQANPTFVSAFLNTKEGKTTLRGMCKSIIGMANINAQELQDISIILPPKELQDDYQQKVKKVTDQKKQVLKTLEKSSHMFDKMSSVYFS
jgi:type I restriction enzyme S subunit